MLDKVLKLMLDKDQDNYDELKDLELLAQDLLTLIKMKQLEDQEYYKELQKQLYINSTLVIVYY